MENKKIFGNLVGVPTPKTDWNQTDETKADYVVGSREYRAEVDSKFANALKGFEKGEMVRAYVSPIEHSMGVRLVSDTITDFSGVTVKQYRKNLIDFFNFDTWEKGFTYLSASGTSYTKDCYVLNNLKSGTSYTISCSFKDDKNISTYFYFAKLSKETHQIVSSEYFTSQSVSKTTYTFVAEDSYYYMIYRGSSFIVTQEEIDKFATFQLEVGGSATEYEEYVEPITHTVNADGTVDGVKSIYPTTTLCADTDGVQINIEYNKDINKAIADLQQAIISLGGNV